VLLVDDRGRFLVQCRAAGKTRFAGRWANACCGHPAPGADLVGEAERRLDEELGLRVDGLRQLGVYLYRAGDARTGRVEHEYDHVLWGRVPAGAALRAENARCNWPGHSCASATVAVPSGSPWSVTSSTRCASRTFMPAPRLP
jgi:isopentenyl-diphosphate delta-isomerase